MSDGVRTYVRPPGLGRLPDDAEEDEMVLARLKVFKSVALVRTASLRAAERLEKERIVEVGAAEYGGRRIPVAWLRNRAAWERARA